MNKITCTAFFALALASPVSSVLAAPIEYQVSGVLNAFVPIASTIPPSQYPVTLPATISATFRYDPTVSATYFSGADFYYMGGAVSNLHGTLEGGEFSAVAGNVFVPTHNGANASFGSGIAYNQASDSGFTGFTADNGLILRGLTIGVAQGSDITNSIPLSGLLGPQSLVYLSATFRSGSNDVVVVFNGYGSISEVPVPAAAWLFGSGLMGLVVVSRKRSSDK